MRTVARQSVGDRTPDAPFGPGNDCDSAGEGQRTPVRRPGHDRNPAFEGVGWQSNDFFDGGWQAGCGATSRLENLPAVPGQLTPGRLAGHVEDGVHLVRLEISDQRQAASVGSATISTFRRAASL